MDTMAFCRPGMAFRVEDLPPESRSGLPRWATESNKSPCCATPMRGWRQGRPWRQASWEEYMEPY